MSIRQEYLYRLKNIEVDKKVGHQDYKEIMGSIALQNKFEN